ncbi:Gfo/Idh/MocA family oxidoreductase [Oscillatoria sp. FACHB-1406]|uniref:Gfo/Idh/MocA family protein n=1 Tax=Oscillatoria sp. FACHB-1406 TaxID=2692846 RepID=UPI001686AE21|nr:Gfo/Idh/MocA family oxidoreductase [Oscillatoria sp. FACHB-1406]MBD2576560.1 Gfo/Idh/MocA family oxidoreductase [Oscillatoria sp. FACHB-1406]
MNQKQPLRVGLVGTGFVAARRTEALLADDRTELIAVAGRDRARTEVFCQRYGCTVCEAWDELVKEPSLDLVIISSINRDRAAMVRAALEAGKHVITEYPLALDPEEAENLIEFAKVRGLLLHVEHIELLGGLHLAIRRSLPEIGNVFYARYVTISPQRPVERRWSYHRELAGFPLVAALSRIHRFTDLFGEVETVDCKSRFWDAEDNYYTACLCAARLQFRNGLMAEVTYGKGEVFWKGERTFELHGDRGTLVFEGDAGWLVRGEEKTAIEVGGRRGLFAKDTRSAIDFLVEGTPLYVSPEASLYALQIADAARADSNFPAAIAR